jgi:hypothetical protein
MNSAIDIEPAVTDQVWSLSRASTRRSLLLAATGALAGLIIAGFGLFTAAGTRTSTIPPEDVAVVNGVPILRVDFISQLRALDDVSLSQASAQQKHAILEDMIADELAVQRGIELGMPTDDTDTRSALTAAVRGQLATDVVAEIPNEAQLRRYYDAHRAHYASEGRMTLRWLTVPVDRQSGAQVAVAALRRGVQPDRAITTFGLKSTGKVDDGEEYYFAAAIHLGPRLFATARAMKDGEVSDPIATQNGLSILVMIHNEPPVAQSFGEARDRVREDYARDRLATVEAANARFLRGRADIIVAPDLR